MLGLSGGCKKSVRPRMQWLNEVIEEATGLGLSEVQGAVTLLTCKQEIEIYCPLHTAGRTNYDSLHMIILIDLARSVQSTFLSWWRTFVQNEHSF